jgi:hypothetical protein
MRLLLVQKSFIIISFSSFFFVFLAFYKNCLLDLNTHRSDVEYALSTIYQEHYEDIDLTSFLKAMCLHLSSDNQK